MPEVQAPPPLPKSQPSFGRRHSTIIKLLGVGALVLVLLIPLAMITGVLNERLRRRNEAVTDVGAALCLFYLLLLSISEFIGFSWAYLVAAVGSTLLITWYCRFFLGAGVRTLMI